MGRSPARLLEDVRVFVEALEPGTAVGPWRVVERLGVGGFGAVYRVEHADHPGEFRALKVALRPADARAEREVTLLTEKAVHDNVVRFHSAGQWPDTPTGALYFVMDWVEGRALDAWAEAVNPSFGRVVHVVGKVALALDALHGSGVLHRDLKPAHILVRSADGEPVLIDFGMGDFAGADTVTDQTVPPGTVHLRSPECVRFHHAHHGEPGARYVFRPADDLYALGVCLYRVVTGHLPFPSNLPPDLLYLLIEGQMPAAPVDVNPRVPRALSDVILRLLAKAPESRYPTGAEVRMALLQALRSGAPDAGEECLFEWEGEGEARRIRRPTVPRRPRAEPRRRVSARWLAVTLACLVGLGAGVVGALRLGRDSEVPVAPALPSSFRETAPGDSSPETSGAAAPLSTAAATTRVAAPPAAPVKEESSVTKPPKSAVGSMKKAAVKAASVAVACAHASCASPQEAQSTRARVASPTEKLTSTPRECPPEAIKNMDAMGIGRSISDKRLVGLNSVAPGEDNRIEPVKAGPGELRMLDEWDGLRGPSVLYGQFIIRDRLYGWFTQVRPDETNELHSVCLVLVGKDRKLGLPLEPGSTASTAYVYSVGYAWRVDRFK